VQRNFHLHKRFASGAKNAQSREIIPKSDCAKHLKKALTHRKQGVAAEVFTSARPMHWDGAMRKIMDHLFAIQKLQFDVCTRTPAWNVEVETHRAKVPPSILARFERLVERDKKGVALARNGVCSECHLRIIEGKLIRLSLGTEIQACDNCGRYLYLAEPVEPPESKSLPPVAVKRARRKAADRVA
jgi:hypothetical protein